jgi:hypothetical protein
VFQRRARPATPGRLDLLALSPPAPYSCSQYPEARAEEQQRRWLGNCRGRRIIKDDVVESHDRPRSVRRQDDPEEIDPITTS